MNHADDSNSTILRFPCQNGLAKGEKQAPRDPCHDKIEVLFPKLGKTPSGSNIDLVELLERITALDRMQQSSIPHLKHFKVKCCG